MHLQPILLSLRAATTFSNKAVSKIASLIGSATFFIYLALHRALRCVLGNNPADLLLLRIREKVVAIHFECFERRLPSE